MRWIIRILMIVAVIVAGLVTLVFLLPADKVAALASDQIRAATGREVTLSGRLKPSVWPQLGVTTGPVTMSNADWSEEGPMLSAEAVRIGVDLAGLFGGDIRVEEVTVQSPRIVLEKSAGGQANWVFEGGGDAAPASAAGSSGGATEFTIGEARIQGGTVIYVDHAAGSRTELTHLDAALGLPDYQGAAAVQLSALAGDEKLTGEAVIGQFGGLLSGQVSPLSLTMTAGGSKIVFEGRGGLSPLAADGALDADLGDLPALFAVLGQPAPDLPAGVGKVIRAAGQVTYAPEGSVHLREAALTLDSNQMSGALDLYLKAKPRLSGSLATGTLDLRPFTGSGGSGSGGGSGQTGWSTAPIDASGLAAIDAEVGISAEKVLTSAATLGRTRVIARLTDSRLVFDIREMRTHDGNVVGNFVVNGRGGLSIGGDLTVSGVSMQSLLAELAGYDRLQASGDLKLKFLGSGNSVNAIMNSLSGEGRFDLGKGELRGLDLAGMLTHLDMGYMGKGAKTIFDSIGASFTIKDGVLQNDDLSMLAPLLDAAGAGKVRIGAQNLNYRVAPTAFKGDDGEGFKVPLIITGTWANPKFNLDLEALAKQRLDLEGKQKDLEEKAKAEVEKAKQKAEEAATKKLGIPTEEDQSLEDAAKKKLEDAAKKKLLKILGGE